MPVPYTSIFDGSTIITKKDLCEILNLDISRVHLNFSPSEIKKAYQKRALLFHPDRQQFATQPIPISVCNDLMNDIALARDHLLKGEDNIPGKAFLNMSQSMFLNPKDWIHTVIMILQSIKAGSSTLASTVSWLSRFSNNYLMMLLFSTFSDGQLNFRFINLLSPQLAAIRPFLEGIDGSSLAGYLHQIKELLHSRDKLNVLGLVEKFKEFLPESLTEHKKFHEFTVEVHGSRDTLKELLTDDFIDHLQHIIFFWPNFIATVPTWKHIMGVYFISLLFTATSLPKFFSALKTISEVIQEQKGTAMLALTALPLLLLAALILPLNILIQFSFQFTWMLVKASLQILVNGAKFLFSALKLISSLFTDSGSLMLQHFFSLFESGLNLTIRLSISLVFETLDTLIFVMTNHSLLSSLHLSFNNAINDLFDYLRPYSTLQERGMNQQQEHALAIVASNVVRQPTSSQKSGQTFVFFTPSDLPLHNEDDIWLKQLLKTLMPEEQSTLAVKEEVASGMKF